MAYSLFTLSEVVRQFSLTVDYDTDLFPVITERSPSALLQTLMSDYFPLGLAIGTEKARSEFVIAPLLAEVRNRAEQRISLFSGVDFNVDIELGLNGFCDFLISRSDDPYFVQAPILTVIEAKNEDIKSGFGQCAASMVGARVFNTRNSVTEAMVYGAVTTGEVWRFLRLTGSDLVIDREERYLKPIERLLGILLQTVNIAIPQTP